MQKFDITPDKDLMCTDYKIEDDKFILIAESTAKEVKYPFCEKASSKVYSVYQREI